MTAVVTGAPGWLGTRLAMRLASAGRRVRCLVLPEADASVLEEIGAEIWRGDLGSPRSLRDLCRGADTVFHAAGVIHPARHGDFWRINVNGTRAILEEAAAHGVGRFLHLSSNAAFGTNDRGGLFDESSPPRPLNGYGHSKLAAERLVEDAHRAGGTRTTIIRPCWFYGEDQPARQTRLFRMIRAGKPFILGDGNARRSLSYVGDVVDALILAANNDRAAGRSFWIADRAPYTIDQIYSTIARELGVKRYHPLHLPGSLSLAAEGVDCLLQRAGRYVCEVHVAGELRHDIACRVDAAREVLGFEPGVGLEEGTRRSIAWCRTNGVRI